MKRFIQTWLAAFIFVAGVGGTVATVAAPTSVYAAPECEKTLLSIPPWYRNLTGAFPDCNILSPTDDPYKGDIAKYIWTIVLNVIEIMLHLVAYITVGFIIYGGFKYMLSAGSADGMSKAKTTIMNAVIGLVLSIVSIAIVKVVAGAI